MRDPFDRCFFAQKPEVHQALAAGELQHCVSSSLALVVEAFVELMSDLNLNADPERNKVHSVALQQISSFALRALQEHFVRNLTNFRAAVTAYCVPP